MKNQILDFFFRITQTSVWQIFIQRPLSVKRGWTAALNRLSLIYIALSLIPVTPLYLDFMNNPVPKSIQQMRVDVGVLLDVNLGGRRSIGSFKIKTTQGQFLIYSASMPQTFRSYIGREIKVFSKQEFYVFGFKKDSLKPYQIISNDSKEFIQKFNYQSRYSSHQAAITFLIYYISISLLFIIRLFIKYRK